jgi:hypothetical protein
VNKDGSGYPKLPYVKRMASRQRFGIRANRNLDFEDCFWSIFWGTQNEFLAIWIYIAFTLYFWIETFMIVSKAGVYETVMKDESLIEIFFVTFSMAISFSITTVYLIFYPRDFVTKVYLQALHYVGILLMVYVITFVLTMIEP